MPVVVVEVVVDAQYAEGMCVGEVFRGKTSPLEAEVYRSLI